MRGFATPRWSAVAVMGLIVLAGVLVLRWGQPGPAVRADQPQLRSGHGHHLPPTKGSERYQYAYPSEKRLPAEAVFDATPPPPQSKPVHEFELVIEENVPHEVAPGIEMPAWTFNGKVPGPILRAREGETIRVKLVNRGTQPHTIHFHGIHPAPMDGVFELVPPGQSYTYEFEAQPYGVFPYHCHSNPSSQHIHNGLYGMMIIDPKEGRAPMKELAMVMSAFDLDRDGEADFYAWNGKAFQYADHPIELKTGEPVRMYVMNIFEEMMAPHIHGNMFQLIRSGTAIKPNELTDVVSLGIAERAILEFHYDYPGAYMFQCHFSEHMELGLMGWFQVSGEAKGKSKAATSGSKDAHAVHGADKQ